MRRLRVSILDLVTKGPTRALWGRAMQPNFASIMPQVVGVWCEEAGHDVRFLCYTGLEDLTRELPADTDLLFIAAYTQSAQLSYAVSSLYRKRGVVTVLGGSHARCYPEDASQYFDYVLGFTDKALVDDVLRDCAPHRPGLQLAAKRQPTHLPGIKQRWKFIAPTIAKTPVIKLVPMIASLGCPYSCSFCIDATVDYQPLDTGQIKEDLRFLLGQMRRPRVGWHDPNFGVRFDEIMSAIEEAVPPGRIDFAAESSLALLSEPHLKRLRASGFKAMLPGVESWYSLGGKSKTGAASGLDKVRKVADHLNMVLSYIPYVQANFVLGLDEDEGDEPFELTKRFVDLSPGVFPAYSLLSAFGQAAPLNLDLQRAGRVLATPFHFLDNNRATNVRPKNYTWAALYENVIGLRKHSFSWRAVGRRFAANRGAVPRWLNALRARSSEGAGRIRYDATVRRLLDSDASLRRFFDGETTALPRFYTDQMRSDLGFLWDSLPEGALAHDQNAYLRTHAATSRSASRVESSPREQAAAPGRTPVKPRAREQQRP
jgi:hypothetical protein